MKSSFWVRAASALVDRASTLVPLEHRESWHETWQGELFHRRRELSTAGPLSRRQEWDLFLRSLGAVSHAAWLRKKEWSLDVIVYELIHSARQWFKRPALAVVAIGTLALGIGANTYIYGLVDGLLLRPFPYPEVDQLVTIGVSFPKQSQQERFIEAISAQDYFEVTESSQTLEHFLAFDMGNRDLGGIDRPERILTGAFWGDPFATLGISPKLGRAFSDEEILTRSPVAIISHRLWRRHFGADPDPLGKAIIINGTPRTIIGVMPERVLLMDTDLWVPMWYERESLPRRRRPLTVLARKTASADTVDAELATIAERIAKDLGSEHPQYEGFRMSASPLVDVWASFVGPAGLILLIAMGAVLWIVCANLAAVMLARASTRRHEMAVRSALGASRGRLAQQLLFEAGWLALLGGALGLGLATVALGATKSFLPEGLPLGSIEFGLNTHVLLYNLVISGLGVVFFGLAPALEAMRTETHGPQSQLVTEQRSATGSRSNLIWRRALVVFQIAVSLVLLCGASLLLQSERNLSRVDPGMRLDGALSFRLTLPWERYESKIQTFFLDLVERIQMQGNVASAALTTEIPPFVRDDDVFEIESVEHEEFLPNAAFAVVTPGWLDTMEMTLLEGRKFLRSDTAETTRVGLVNETLVRRYFEVGSGENSRDPIGARLRVGRREDAPWITIVGVVADSHNQGLDRPPTAQIYASFAQAGQFANQAFVVARGAGGGDPMDLLPTLRNVVREIDPHLPIYSIQTMEARFGQELANRRMLSFTIGSLGLLAVFLAMMGLYGVVAFISQQREREFGIRLAMGAKRSQLLNWVLARSLTLVGLGLFAGACLTWFVGSQVESMLFGVRANDPFTLAGSAGLIAAVATVAAFFPARRAATTDPVNTLRG